MKTTKLTAILIGIAITVAMSVFPGLQYAHANGGNSGNTDCKDRQPCDASQFAPGNGGLVPGHSTGATETGKASGITPHQCTIGECVS